MRYIINTFKFLIFSLFILSCEERVELDFVEFTPGSLSDNDGKITYSDVDVYPLLDVISTDTPSVDNSIKTGIVFRIDTVKAPAESSYDNSKFSIDKLTFDSLRKIPPIEKNKTGVKTKIGLAIS